jgi:transcription antitermination factor NusG
LGRPAEIQANEIQEIKAFLTGYVNVEVIGKSVKVGDFITIQSGVFEGKVAQVRSFKNKKEVRLYIESLGYELVAQLADKV